MREKLTLLYSFLLTPSKTLKDELAQNCSKAETELGGLVVRPSSPSPLSLSPYLPGYQTQAKYLEKQINETENSVKELIVSVQRK